MQSGRLDDARVHASAALAAQDGDARTQALATRILADVDAGGPPR